MWKSALVGGIIGFVLVMLMGIFGALRRQISAAAAALTDKELDSGVTKMTTRYKQFKSADLMRGGLRRNYVQAVLTKTHLHLIERPQRYGIFKREDLGNFTVGTIDGMLHLHSKTPPDATGGIDYRIDVAEPERWVKALVAAGAKRAS
jgi:hypothetical protein